MGTRKDLTTLTNDEKSAFVNALIELKKSGIYDRYVKEHDDSMANFTTVSEEIPHPGIRNSAHRGPAFLPWHREFLRRFELDLQRIDSTVGLPYWNWAADAELENPELAPIWSDEFMGGDGVVVDSENPENPENDVVQSGPFAFENGQWLLRSDLNGPKLKRHFGRFAPNLPKLSHIQNALRIIYYDMPPFDASQFTRGFRNYIEGWVRIEADSRFDDRGTQLHNRVHVWVGGSMLPGTSPNDPVFFLHHCFIDKIWSDWQRIMQDPVNGAPELTPHYFPLSGGPIGHNLYDPMYPWGGGSTPASVLNNEAIGVTYIDKPETLVEFNATATSRAVSDIRTIVPDSPYAE